MTDPKIIRREDYTAPDWLVPDIALDFDLRPSKTSIKSVLSVTRNGDHARSRYE
jgi:aminopeptidase N